MVTKEQALSCNYFHYTGKYPCTRHIGLRGGVTERITQVRRSRATKVWITRPDEFKVPVKYGMYESAYITHDNAQDWHVASECPLDKGEVPCR